MTLWPSAKLGDLLEVQNGFAFKSDKFSEDHGIPLIRIRDLPNASTEIKYDGEYRPEFVVDPGDYLIGMDGEFKCHQWAGPRGLLNQRVCRLTNFASHVLPEYIYYSIDRKLQAIQHSTAFVTVKHISSKQIAKIEIPLPPLGEQHRLVDILSRAHGVRALRREAQEKARQVTPALFVEMFGDPVKNPHGWSRCPLCELGKLDRGKSKHRPRNDPRLLGGPYPFIQTGDVANSGGLITVYTATYSEFGLAQSKLWPSGTLCITIAANIARTGVLAFEACFPDSVVGFIPGNRVTTAYVQSALDFLQPQLEAFAPQLAQKNINLEILRTLPIPVPPFDVQQAFAGRLLDFQSVITQQARSAAAADQLVASLMAQVFAA